MVDSGNVKGGIPEFWGETLLLLLLGIDTLKFLIGKTAKLRDILL
jgi:hypothetical protein